jgi:hypothetical protein
MEHEKYWNSSAKFSSEKTRLHALQLYVTRSIGKQYGASVQTDPETKTINLTLPDTKGDVCAREVERQVGAMYHNISTLVELLESGEILIRIMHN